MHIREGDWRYTNRILWIFKLQLLLYYLHGILEKIERSAARFVTQNYRPTASVASLIQNLGWNDLKTRRENSRLICMFKILNELVEIPINDRLISADKRTCGGYNRAYKHMCVHVCI